MSRALDAAITGHHRMLLCAADIAATEPSLVMAARFAGSVPVRNSAANPARLASGPWRSLFDCSTAARVLGWQPRYQWSNRGHDERTNRGNEERP